MWFMIVFLFPATMGFVANRVFIELGIGGDPAQFFSVMVGLALIIPMAFIVRILELVEELRGDLRKLKRVN